MRTPPNPQALQRQCDAFNDRYPVGQRVSVLKDSGEAIITTTREPAQVLSGHTAVIWVNGISGCYMLDRVAAVAREL